MFNQFYINYNPISIPPPPVPLPTPPVEAIATNTVVAEVAVADDVLVYHLIHMTTHNHTNNQIHTVLY
jgi:hypothetical protein